MAHSQVAQIGNHYFYCTKRSNNVFMYDIYGFDFNINDEKYEIKFKHTVNLQLYENKKKMNIKILRVQYDCVIFGIEIRNSNTIICLFRFDLQQITSKHVFRTEFDTNQVKRCNLVSNIILFHITDTNKKNAPYYALFALQNDRQISVQYIHTWPKNILNPLIVINPCIIHPTYQLASCLKNSNNNNSSDIIWDLSLCIPESYLRNLTYITPHMCSISESNYANWYWWISVQKPGKECKILLIKNKQIITRIPFTSENNIIKPLSLISINMNTVLFMSEMEYNNDKDNDSDDIDMESKTESCIECHIIKRDSFKQNKYLIRKQYKQWFSNENENNNNELNIYKVFYKYQLPKKLKLYHYDAKYMMLLCYKMGIKTFKINEFSEDNIGYIQWNYESFDIKKLLMHKIPKFFENSLNALTLSHAKQFQKCFHFRHDMLSQFNNQLHAVKPPLINDEIICCDWKTDSNLNSTPCRNHLVMKLPFASNNSNETRGIILSCPYIRFTAFSMSFKMENPTQFMESMAIGDFIDLSQDLKCQSLMIHLFERDTLKLEHLAVYKLSLEQLNRMKCNSQNMCFYDGLQQKEINNYLNEISEDDIYDGLLKYFNTFVECFEKELEENIKENENNFYEVLRTRLCSDIIPVTVACSTN